jgi:hypothetical protein
MGQLGFGANFIKKFWSKFPHPCLVSETISEHQEK